jgi:hypothetical protein
MGHCGPVHMVVRFTSTYAISALSTNVFFQIAYYPRRGIYDATLSSLSIICNKSMVTSEYSGSLHR